MVKFFEEFTKRSNGEYPMLKFNSATYYKQNRELIVRFIISAFEVRSFDDNSKAKVLKIISDMFDGVNVSVQYIRTYADVNVVKNKVLEFFNRTNQMVFRRINDETLQIFVGDADIEVKLKLETPTYKMLMAGDLTQKLESWLDRSFNQNIEVVAEEDVVELKEIMEKEDLHIDTTVVTDPSLRLVDIHTKEKVYARGKIDGVSQLPNYIIDVKGASDNIVLCGKISNISKRTYRNKKHDPDDPKTGPAELPLVRFILDDTTAKIEGVCFPREEDAEKIENLQEQTQVVCTGKVGVSAYNNALSFTVNAIFTCDINFDSIHLTSVKPVPERYETIFPQPYRSVTQNSLLDTDEVKVADYMKDKKFVIFDLEATDKFPETAEIIEIAALKIVNGEEKETFQSLIKPTEVIPSHITELTHISNDMVASAPSIESVMPDFYKFTRDSILVGHNISGYDYPLMNKYAEKMGYNFDNELTDTLLLARKHLTELPNFKLETISKYFNITHENAHRAMSDVFATAEALKIISKRMER